MALEALRAGLERARRSVEELARSMLVDAVEGLVEEGAVVDRGRWRELKAEAYREALRLWNAALEALMRD